MNATTSNRETMIRVKDVHKSYKMGEVEVPVLRDVNLEIYKEELTVIVGPSGSGKTTLLNMLGAMDAPSSGEVWFEDRDISKFNERQLTLFRRETIGFIFQFYNLVPTLTALENVLVSTEQAKSPLDPKDALEIVGLGHRMEHFPSQMSGGEQQRVSIARALAKRPKLLLCDEPTGALDYATGKKVLATLGKLNEEEGLTILIITHNAPIAGMAHQLVRISSGTISETHVNTERRSAEEITW